MSPRLLIRRLRELARPLDRFLMPPLAALLTVAALLSRRRAGIVLVFHRVGDPAGDPARELLPAIGTPLFAAHLRLLRRVYRCVPLSELLDTAAARKRGRRFPASITFDDDARSHLEVAAPILRRNGVPATFFLSGASLERPFTFWYERLQAAFDAGVLEPLPEPLPASASGAGLHEVSLAAEELGARERDAVSAALAERLGPDREDAGLRADEVRALVRDGFEVGFHTRRHDVLPRLDDAELAAALSDGRKELEALSGRPLRALAYPCGKHDERVRRATAAAGFEMAFTTDPVPVEPSTDRMMLGRLYPSDDFASRFAAAAALALLLGRAPRS